VQRHSRSVAVDRMMVLALAALVAASPVARFLLVTYESTMGFVGFATGWTLMMAAMMLPLDRAPCGCSTGDRAQGSPSGTWSSGAGRHRAVPRHGPGHGSDRAGRARPRRCPRAQPADQLVWGVVFATAVFVKEVLPRGELSARLIGVGLLVSALAVAVT
jgi:hypothetical protein